MQRIRPDEAPSDEASKLRGAAASNIMLCTTDRLYNDRGAGIKQSDNKRAHSVSSDGPNQKRPRGSQHREEPSKLKSALTLGPGLNDHGWACTQEDSSSVSSIPNKQHNDLEARERSKHLVRSISDLPIFVTIEDYRVASYSLHGEPHLCLPQLLQFIRQKFPLDKIIEKLEEIVTNFVSASPKQVEGLIKASALPQGAESCSLIKRSDAEWICLSLYDQYTKEKWNSIVDLCSENTSSQDAQRGCQGKSIADRMHSGTKQGTSALPKESLDEHPSPDRDQDHKDSPSHSRSSDVAKTESRSKVLAPCTSGQVVSDIINGPPKHGGAILDTGHSESMVISNNRPLHIGTDKAPSHRSSDESQVSRIKDEQLFKSEAQDSILNLARNATSTLIIQVYHRCFGKCIGLYYPSLLKNSRSNCIECSSCHRILSPRRFIGHTHGKKESNICHWGFNSYNWRHYIRLSKKQLTNKLDDDELLVQFNLLKSVDGEGSDAGTSEFEKREMEWGTESPSKDVVDLESSSKQSVKVANRRHNLDERRSNISQQFGESTPSNRVNLERALDSCTKQPSSSSHTNSGAGINLWQVSQESVLQVRDMLKPCTTDYLAPHQSNDEIGAFAHFINPMSTASLCSTTKDLTTSFQSSLFSRLSSSNGDLRSLELLSQLRGHHLGGTNFARIPSTSSVSLDRTAQEKLINQDLFVSTALTDYLTCKGMQPELVSDIVTSTRSFMQRSRMLF